MRSCMLALIFAITAACSSTTEPGSTLRVTTTLSSTVYHPGDSVWVTVDVHNLGLASREIPVNECPQQYQLLNNNGQRVGPPGYVCALVGYTFVLHGLEHHMIRELLLEGAKAGVGSPANSVAPGTYVVSASYYPVSQQGVRPTIQVLP